MTIEEEHLTNMDRLQMNLLSATESGSEAGAGKGSAEESCLTVETEDEINQINWNRAKKGNATIAAFKLTNIQSYDDSVGWIELNPVGLTVFVARSETGKSVFFKVCDCMCFPLRFGVSTRRGLIRRGHDSGTCEMRLTNGTYIKVTFNRSSTSYEMTRKGEATHTWKASRLPEEVQSELAWYIDYENKQLLNMIDEHNGGFFIKHSSKYTASVLKCITQDPKIEQARKSIDEWSAVLAAKQKDVFPKFKFVESQLISHPYVNESLLEERLTKKKKICSVWEKLDTLEEQLTYLTSIVASKPQEVKDLTALENLAKALHNGKTSESDVKELIEIVETKPEGSLKEINHKHCEEIIVCKSNLRGLAKESIDLYELINTKPAEVQQLNAERCESLQKSIHSVKGLYASLSELMKEVTGKPPEVESLVSAEPYHQGIQQVKALSQNFIEYVNALQDFSKIKKASSILSKEISELESTLGVCPVCGSQLK